MRKDFGAKPFLFPMPVLILAAYDENGIPNAMNAAWGAIFDYEQISIVLDADHKTTQNILRTKAFTVSPADAAHVTEADYLGIVSGNTVPDKLARTGLRVRRSERVNAPVIEELPMTLECEFISFSEETGQLIGRIVNVSADECILGEDGKIDPQKLRPITFDPVHNLYRELGAAVGHAFSDGKKLK